VEPTITNAEIQQRCQTIIFENSYMVKLDGDPVAVVDLHGEYSYQITVLIRKPNRRQ
jgi:hypothetical protein